MRNLTILGGGFAGVWAAMSAAAERKELGQEVAITLLSKDPHLTIRPRLYEGARKEMCVPLAPLMDEIGVAFAVAEATGIDSLGRTIQVNDADDLAFDRLVLASGSRMRQPSIPGVEAHAFSIDTLQETAQLDRHIEDLPAEAEGSATFVVVGASFTGLELATELRGRLGPDARIVLIDQAATAGADLGANVRPIVNEALSECRIETRLGAKIAGIGADEVRLDGGETLATQTVILATGLEASPLTRFIPGARDGLGRLRVGRDLKVSGMNHIFAAGDTAHALTDDEHVALMSCQHALRLGRFAGYNALRDLLGRKTAAYRQEVYVTCLDLGPWGAVFTNGWDRRLQKIRADGKAMKRRINRERIYPPSPDIGADEIFRTFALPAESRAT